MAVKTQSFAMVARIMDETMKRIGDDAKKGFKIAVDAAYKDAHEQLSGTTSTKQLRKENHPYGRGGTTPKGKRRGRRKDLPINAQTGRLRSGLYRRSGRDTKGAVEILGVKKTAYSKYILSPSGTSRMRTRPLWRYVQGRHKARMLAVMGRLRKRAA